MSERQEIIRVHKNFRYECADAGMPFKGNIYHGIGWAKENKERRSQRYCQSQKLRAWLSNF